MQGSVFYVGSLLLFFWQEVLQDIALEHNLVYDKTLTLAVEDG